MTSEELSGLAMIAVGAVAMAMVRYMMWRGQRWLDEATATLRAATAERQQTIALLDGWTRRANLDAPEEERRADA